MAKRVRVTADLYQEGGTIYMTTNDLPGFPPTRLADGKGARAVRDALAAAPTSVQAEIEGGVTDGGIDQPG